MNDFKESLIEISELYFSRFKENNNNITFQGIFWRGHIIISMAILAVTTSKYD